MNADRSQTGIGPSRPTRRSLSCPLFSLGRRTRTRRTDRHQRPGPEQPTLPGLCENRLPPLATAPARRPGSWLAHRAQQTTKIGLRDVCAHPNERPANLDLHAPRLSDARLRRGAPLDLRSLARSGPAPSKKLRGRDIQRTRQRRDIRAWLQRRRNRPLLEFVGPAPTFSYRRSLEPCGSHLDELVRVSSRHRRRHRSYYPCQTPTI